MRFEVHNKGYGLGDTYGIEGRKPIDFFVIDEDDPRGAAEVITLSKDILDSLDAIAAASAPTVGGTDPDSGPGDNQNLLEIINFQHTANISSDFYAGIMGELGVDTQQAIRISDNQRVLMEHLENPKEAVSGVSLDEEIAHMIQYQHAYSAAARLVTAVDEILDVIINRMGLIGR